MGHLPVIANVYRVTLEWTVGGSLHMANVLHVQQAGTTSPDISTEIQSKLTPDMFEAVSSSAHLTGVSVIQLDGSSSTYHQSLDGSFDGQGGTEFVPQEAAIISLFTGLRGPRHRGRVFLPAVAEDRQSSGIIASGARTTMEGAWTDFIDGLAVDGTALVVASYAHSTASFVIGCTAKQRSGTQRRRNTL